MFGKKNENGGIEMEVVQIRLTKNMLNIIDEMIEMGDYPSRSETIRDGVRRLIEQKYWKMK